MSARNQSPLRLGWAAALIVLGVGLSAIGLFGSPIAVTARGLDRASSHWDDGILRQTAVLTSYVYMPFISKEDVCRPVEGESYGFLEIPNWQASPPAGSHPDLNLAVRGYTPTTAFLGSVDIPGSGTDPGAPQLAGLYATPHLPAFLAVYQVYDWDWTNNRRGDPISDPEVTLADLAATPGEAIHVPDSGYRISPDYEVLVLYASAERLTLKFTIEDNIGIPPTGGYAIHVENVCVDPNLLALYQTLNNMGRHALPALRTGQAFGRARSDHVGVAIRDTGAFMDPRSREDWWHGY